MCRTRRARKDEAEIATQIAKLAKASWGYPDKWLEEWDPELTISVEYMEANEVFVAEDAGVIVGIAALGRTSGEPTLEHLWILPDHQRKGIGRQLFQHAAKEAKNMGWEGFQIISDRYAEEFYKRLGATKIDEIPAPVAGTDRSLPLLELKL